MIAMAVIAALAITVAMIVVTEPDAPVNATLVLKSGAIVGCPYGLVWLTDQPTVLCRTGQKDSGFIVQGVAVADIESVEVRP